MSARSIPGLFYGSYYPLIVSIDFFIMSEYIIYQMMFCRGKLFLMNLIKWLKGNKNH